MNSAGKQSWLLLHTIARLLWTNLGLEREVIAYTKENNELNNFNGEELDEKEA